MSRYKSKEFLELKAQWDKTLAKAGFEDIEQEDGNLKIWTSHFFKARHNPTLFAAKEDYYRLAGHFLNEHVFKDETERYVWEMHANGTSIREIAALLKQLGLKSYKNKVHKVVQDLTKIMLVRHNDRK